jgi:hypothetical protein
MRAGQVSVSPVLGLRLVFHNLQVAVVGSLPVLVGGLLQPRGGATVETKTATTEGTP